MTSKLVKMRKTQSWTRSRKEHKLNASIKESARPAPPAQECRLRSLSSSKLNTEKKNLSSRMIWKILALRVCWEMYQNKPSRKFWNLPNTSMVMRRTEATPRSEDTTIQKFRSLTANFTMTRRSCLPATSVRWCAARCAPTITKDTPKRTSRIPL